MVSGVDCLYREENMNAVDLIEKIVRAVNQVAPLGIAALALIFGILLLLLTK